MPEPRYQRTHPHFATGHRGVGALGRFPEARFVFSALLVLTGITSASVPRTQH